MALDAKNVRYWLPVQPVDATLSIVKGKDGVYGDASKIFSRLQYGRENGDFGILGRVRRTLGFKPQKKE